MDSTVALIGSIVIASIFLLGVMSFYGDLTDYSHEKTYQLLVQETTASFMEIIDHDFRRMGGGLSSPGAAIVSMVDTTDITFLADINEDSVIDTVRYYTSDVTAASATQNPNDVILYRVVNGTNSIDSPAGVTSFIVRPLDELGNKITDTMAVRMLDVVLIVENPYPYNQEYFKALWEKRIGPQNLYRQTLTDF